FVSAFVPKSLKESCHAPVASSRIDVITDRDQARAVILAEFAEQIGVHAAKDPTKILRDYQIDCAAFHRLRGLARLRPIQALATTLGREHSQVIRSFEVLVQPPAEEGFLIAEAALVLVEGADAGDPQNLIAPSVDWHLQERDQRRRPPALAGA